MHFLSSESLSVCNKPAAWILARVNQFERVSGNSRWNVWARKSPTPQSKKTPKCPFKYQNWDFNRYSIATVNSAYSPYGFPLPLSTSQLPPLKTEPNYIKEKGTGSNENTTLLKVNQRKSNIWKYWGQSRSTPFARIPYRTQQDWRIEMFFLFFFSCLPICMATGSILRKIFWSILFGWQRRPGGVFEIFLDLTLSIPAHLQPFLKFISRRCCNNILILKHTII